MPTYCKGFNLPFLVVELSVDACVEVFTELLYGIVQEVLKFLSQIKLKRDSFVLELRIVENVLALTKKNVPPERETSCM